MNHDKVGIFIATSVIILYFGNMFFGDKILPSWIVFAIIISPPILAILFFWFQDYYLQKIIVMIVLSCIIILLQLYLKNQKRLDVCNKYIHDDINRTICKKDEKSAIHILKDHEIHDSKKIDHMLIESIDTYNFSKPLSDELKEIPLFFGFDGKSKYCNKSFLYKNILSANLENQTLENRYFDDEHDHLLEVYYQGSISDERYSELLKLHERYFILPVEYKIRLECHGGKRWLIDDVYIKKPTTDYEKIYTDEYIRNRYFATFLEIIYNRITK